MSRDKSGNKIYTFDGLEANSPLTFHTAKDYPPSWPAIGRLPDDR
jgi:hypothetical protein